MLSTCLPSSPPPRYSLENRPSILFDPVSPAIPRGGVHFSSGTPTPKVGGLPDFKMSVVRADSDSDEGEFPTTRLSSIQLKRAPVLTICGIKIQCSLEVSIAHPVQLYYTLRTDSYWERIVALYSAGKNGRCWNARARSNGHSVSLTSGSSSSPSSTDSR